MTLTTRLLLFYLGSLVVLLTGFSVTLYILAKDHLQQQSNERLESVLNTLSAAVEISPDGVEWEPNQHDVRIVAGTTADQLAWVVTDVNGHVVARSEKPASDDLLMEAAGRFPNTTSDLKRLYWRGERWQAGQRLLLPGGTKASTESKPTDPKEVKYSALVITSAIPLEPMRAILRRMIGVLSSVSIAILVIALFAGRFVCCRALRPVQRMAADARSVDSTDPERRIVTPSSGDELTDLGSAFNGLLDRLHVSLERQRRFTGDASHQLRTPLAALMGQIEIALRRERSGTEYREALTKAQFKAAQLQRIIESLLYLTRSDTEGAVPDCETFDLAVWLQKQLESWVDHLRYPDIQIVAEEMPLLVNSHPILLGEILNILFDNACQYSPISSAITMKLSLSERNALLEVVDHGPGIAEHDLQHLFTPFFRTAEARNTNKSGKPCS